MLSVASVRTAGGAASYFAGDNYYTIENSSETSVWGGKGAEALGLSGQVSKEAFENVLNGKLPDGTLVNQTADRRIGVDMTFSMPKSASVLAYVGGDERILAAHLSAVQKTMGWVEGKFAEARDYSRSKNGEGVRTGNLVYALFQHDTSRKLDPQGHIHAVIAAVTKTADGTWKALWNGELWKNNTTIGAAYHAAFRAELQKLGYEVELTGKHGQFEIKGVPKEVLQEFSQRREEVLAKAGELNISDPKAMDRVVVNSRDKKVDAPDREAMREGWQDRARTLGFDGSKLVRAAMERSGAISSEKPMSFSPLVKEIAGEARSVLGTYFRAYDALTTNGLARGSLTPTEMRTEMAVASAIRILGQREAAFAIDEVSKTALDLGFKGVTIDGVESRIEALTEQRQLIPGKIERLDGTLTHVTTPEHIEGERKLLAGIDAGRGQAPVILEAATAPERLQAIAGDRPLNGEQLGAAVLALSSSDRIVVIQGVAGAGKTTLIQAVAGAAKEEGRDVVGIAFANKMVGMLRDEAGIEAQTVSSFVNAHLSGALAGKGERFETSRSALAGKIVVLDEASLVATEGMNNLVTIANNLGIERLVLIGDHKQLLPIDNGKAFVQVQGHEPAMARLDTSQRQTTDEMKMVATLTREGKFREAFDVLGGNVQSANNDYRAAAAQQWLALPAAERERTALYASGRDTRSELNELIQDGLKAEGLIGAEGRTVTTLSAINATREEMRFAGTYKAGQVIDVVRNSAPGGLARGRYDVVGTDGRGRVKLLDERGRAVKFNPQKIDPADKRDAINLSEKEKVTLHEGDRLRWTANDKDRGLLNSEQARVVGIAGDVISVMTAKGETLALSPGDKMLERLGLAYAINMHQAQGMTTDKGIGVMHSSERNLSTQRLFHVMATRVREAITVFTNDKDQLLRTIEANKGDKSSALETIGEKSRAERSTKTKAGGHPSASGGDQSQQRRDPADFRRDPSKHVEPEHAAPKEPAAPAEPSKAPTPQLPLPQKTLDLSL